KVLTLIFPFHDPIIHLIKFFAFKQENFQFMMIFSQKLINKFLLIHRKWIGIINTDMMKYPILFFFLLASIWAIAQEQTEANILITSNKEETKVRTNERGELQINVSKKDL